MIWFLCGTDLIGTPWQSSDHLGFLSNFGVPFFRSPESFPRKSIQCGTRKPLYGVRRHFSGASDGVYRWICSILSDQIRGFVKFALKRRAIAKETLSVSIILKSHPRCCLQEGAAYFQINLECQFCNLYIFFSSASPSLQSMPLRGLLTISVSRHLKIRWLSFHSTRYCPPILSTPFSQRTHLCTPLVDLPSHS
jgi:hypothetical protein